MLLDDRGLVQQRLDALYARGGDPGVGIALVPLGLVLLLVAIASTLRALRA